jgi:hypothetical protein
LAFKNLKNLIGHRFSSNSEVTVPVSYWWQEQGKDFFSVIPSLPAKLRKCITLETYYINPSTWPFKSCSKMIYSSLFLNYMRYKHEIFTKMILKDGFIILPYNMSALYLSNGDRWVRSWGVYGTPWSILLNTTMPHIHYTSNEILSSGLFLCTPHIFYKVLPFSPWGEYAPGNVFPWVF